jgi:hypothetical protein
MCCAGRSCPTRSEGRVTLNETHRFDGDGALAGDVQGLVAVPGLDGTWPAPADVAPNGTDQHDRVDVVGVAPVDAQARVDAGGSA